MQNPVADSPGRAAPDLTACDVEPIHIPGSIQPHGMLLVVNVQTLEVEGVAGDIEIGLAPKWLGRPLAELLGQDVGHIEDGAANIALPQVRGRSGAWDAVAHRSGDDLLIELEPATAEPPTAQAVLAQLDAAGGLFERAVDLSQLCHRAATVFHQLTGFDRVMVYQFLDNDSGVVLAEAKADDLGSFMNHHFPATDIPRQARALYVRNRVRVIPDVGYAPAPLRGRAALASLDLSDVALRSVSPIHIQYLKNMGVAASASVSIVKDGRLWGLIACHSARPTPLSFAARMACRALAAALSREIKAKEDAQTYRERIRLRDLEDTALRRLAQAGSLEAFFESASDDLRRALDADGFAAVYGGEIYAAGHCPSLAGVRDLAHAVKHLAATQPLATDQLAARFPHFEIAAEASGLLAVTLSVEDPSLLMWFRAEQLQVVDWAGNPHKHAIGPTAALTPRDSFEAWSETVRGRSRTWTLSETESAGRLRHALLETRQTQRIRELNRELTKTIGDKESLLQQKDFLINEVNHRVQNSLQLVSSFLRMQARAGEAGSLADNLNEAQNRISAIALVHRRLYTESRVQTIDLGRYLDDLCVDMNSSMGGQWNDQIALDLAPILVSTDRAVNIGLIVTELIINANKYAYGGEPGPVAITLDQQRNRLRLVVADKGSGKTASREGFGTRMLQAMIKSLDGTLEEAGNHPGLQVTVTAPIG